MRGNRHKIILFVKYLLKISNIFVCYGSRRSLSNYGVKRKKASPEMFLCWVLNIHHKCLKILIFRSRHAISISFFKFVCLSLRPLIWLSYDEYFRSREKTLPLQVKLWLHHKNSNNKHFFNKSKYFVNYSHKIINSEWKTFNLTTKEWSMLQEM